MIFKRKGSTDFSSHQEKIIDGERRMFSKLSSVQSRKKVEMKIRAPSHILYKKINANVTSQIKIMASLCSTVLSGSVKNWNAEKKAG